MFRPVDKYRHTGILEGAPAAPMGLFRGQNLLLLGGWGDRFWCARAPVQSRPRCTTPFGAAVK
jgi:hypothetical protein